MGRSCAEAVNAMLSRRLSTVALGNATRRSEALPFAPRPAVPLVDTVTCAFAWALEPFAFDPFAAAPAFFTTACPVVEAEVCACNAVNPSAQPNAAYRQCLKLMVNTPDYISSQSKTPHPAAPNLQYIRRTNPDNWVQITASSPLHLP
jgi:hypothetical protein